MNITRRQAIAGAAAVAATAALPAVAEPAMHVGFDLASGPDTEVWFIRWGDGSVEHYVPDPEWLDIIRKRDTRLTSKE